MSTNQTNGVLNRHAVKARLGISDTTFWDLLRKGKLHGFYVGRDLRFEPAEVQRYIDEGKARFNRKWGQSGTDDAQKGGVANG